MSYDFGAYGSLSAKANIPNIGEKSARVKRGGITTDKTQVKIPVDDNNNFIADCWFGDNGQANDDNDNVPQSNYPGDGLTRYEEYRLFRLAVGAERLDPDKKDVFIFDDASVGVRDFTNLGLCIHLWSPNADREGNLVNIYRKTATKGPQYGIRTEKKDEIRKTSDQMYYIFGETPEPWLNSPDVHIILYTGSIDAAAQEYGLNEDQKNALINSVIGHELGHAVNITHCLNQGCIMYPAVNIFNPNHTYCQNCKAKVNLTKVQQ